MRWFAAAGYLYVTNYEHNSVLRRTSDTPTAWETVATIPEGCGRTPSLSPMRIDAQPVLLR